MPALGGALRRQEAAVSAGHFLPPVGRGEVRVLPGGAPAAVAALCAPSVKEKWSTHSRDRK